MLWALHGRGLATYIGHDTADIACCGCGRPAGYTKFIIQRIEIEEPQIGGTSRLTTGLGASSSGPVRERHAIVSAWNPDESWDDDPAVHPPPPPPPLPVYTHTWQPPNSSFPPHPCTPAAVRSVWLTLSLITQ